MTMRVFLAGTSPDLSERLTGMLSQIDGLEIAGQAHNMPDALSAIRELRPDVVLIDVDLLGKDGLHLLKALNPEGQAPFIMMLANDVSRPYRKLCLNAGANFLVDKSADLLKTLSILKELLPRYHSGESPNE